MTAATALHFLACSAHDVAGILTSIHTVLTQRHQQRGLVAKRTAQYHGHVGELCAKRKHHVAKLVELKVDTLHHDGVLFQLSGNLFAQLLHFFLVELLHLGTEHSVVVDRFSYCSHQILAVEQLADAIQHILHAVDISLSGLACHSLNTTHAGSNGALADDAQHAYATGVRYMGAATELNAVAEFYHTHPLAVFLAKESHGTQLLSFGNGHGTVFLEGNGAAYVFIHQMLHLPQFFMGQLGKMREVETQALVVNTRTLLLNMIAKDFSQRLVQQVGGAVVALDGGATLGIDLGGIGGI